MAPDKSLAAESEAVLSGRDDERVARILCDVWGYQWDGDPDTDENVIPERAGGDYDRPGKETFIAGAVAIRSQIIAPLIAALQSRGFEDGARWMRERAVERAETLWEWIPEECVLEPIETIAEEIRNLPLQPEGERNA